MKNEQRLIDANVFAEHLERMTKTTYPNLLPGLLEAAEFARDFLPNVDAVEVVRCKNCKKWNEKTGVCEEFTSHRLPSGGRVAFITRENDFCSYGERRDSE